MSLDYTVKTKTWYIKRIPRKLKKELKKNNPWIKRLDKEHLISLMLAKKVEYECTDWNISNFQTFHNTAIGLIKF